MIVPVGIIPGHNPLPDTLKVPAHISHLHVDHPPRCFGDPAEGAHAGVTRAHDIHPEPLDAVRMMSRDGVISLPILKDAVFRIALRPKTFTKGVLKDFGQLSHLSFSFSSFFPPCRIICLLDKRTMQWRAWNICMRLSQPAETSRHPRPGSFGFGNFQVLPRSGQVHHRQCREQ